MPRRHVLVGGGPAASPRPRPSATPTRCRRITIVAADPHGYYSRPGLAYLLTRELPEDGSSPSRPSSPPRWTWSRIVDRATAIDPAAHGVAGERPASSPTTACCSPPGPRRSAPLPGAELDGVVKLDDLDDARRHPRAAAAGKTRGGGRRRHHRAGDRRGPARARHARALLPARRPLLGQRALGNGVASWSRTGCRKDGVEVHQHTEAGSHPRRQRTRHRRRDRRRRTPSRARSSRLRSAYAPRSGWQQAAGLDCGRGDPRR